MGMLSNLQAYAIHYIHQAWHTLPSPNPHVPIDTSYGPPGLWPLDSRVIQWHIYKDWICLVELFGGIHFNLIKVLQYGIKVCQYNYAEKDLKLGKLPCTILWCYDNNILSYCLHWWSRVTITPYRTTSHCWGCRIWTGSNQWTWSYKDGRVKVYHRRAQIKDFQTQIMVILGFDSGVAIFTNLSTAFMRICVGKCPTFGRFVATCIGNGNKLRLGSRSQCKWML